MGAVWRESRFSLFPRSSGNPMRGTQKGEWVKNDENVAAGNRKMRNNYAGYAGANLRIIFAFWRQVRLREMHFSNNGDCVKKTLSSVFLSFFLQ